MELKFKRLKDRAVLPIRAHKSDAGLDLTCTDVTTALNEANQLMLVYHTDLAVEIPEGYVGLLFPRSSIWKKTLMQTNAVGVIDAGYRGELMVTMRSTTDVVPAVYKPGERFAQLVIVPIPDITVVEATELEESERGEGGFGSTGTEEIKDSADAPLDSSSAASDEVEEPSVPDPAADPFSGSEIASDNA